MNFKRPSRWHKNSMAKRAPNEPLVTNKLSATSVYSTFMTSPASLASMLSWIPEKVLLFPAHHVHVTVREDAVPYK